MADKVIVFGKDDCPYTARARAALAAEHKHVDYRDVAKNPAHLVEMLALTGGRREVPVIVERGKVTVGYGGGS
jgi:glutaredoxin 3